MARHSSWGEYETYLASARLVAQISYPLSELSPQTFTLPRTDQRPAKDDRRNVSNASGSATASREIACAKGVPVGAVHAD